VSDPKIGWTVLTAIFAPVRVADLADTKGYWLQSTPWQTQKSLVILAQPTSGSDIKVKLANNPCFSAKTTASGRSTMAGASTLGEARHRAGSAHYNPLAGKKPAL